MERRLPPMPRRTRPEEEALSHEWRDGEMQSLPAIGILRLRAARRADGAPLRMTTGSKKLRRPAPATQAALLVSCPLGLRRLHAWRAAYGPRNVVAPVTV